MIVTYRSLERNRTYAASIATAFHRQFKALTAMTPIQFQKQIRLLEARRLMLSGKTSAEAVAFEVGYASPSQFSREYCRMFGLPPARDPSRFLLQLAEEA